jgi:hypothetical protein
VGVAWAEVSKLPTLLGQQGSCTGAPGLLFSSRHECCCKDLVECCVFVSPICLLVQQQCGQRHCACCSWRFTGTGRCNRVLLTRTPDSSVVPFHCLTTCPRQHKQSFVGLDCSASAKLRSAAAAISMAENASIAPAKRAGKELCVRFVLDCAPFRHCGRVARPSLSPITSVSLRRLSRAKADAAAQALPFATCKEASQDGEQQKRCGP